MQNAIKKAIEGGYINGEIETNNDGIWLSNSDKTLHQSDILLDPLFWQCLGKQQKWGLYCKFCGSSKTNETGFWCDICEKNQSYLVGWSHYWHKLIDYISFSKDLSGDIDEFFNQLIK